MRPILIGAGRGRRLGPHTDEIPKALVCVMGRPILEWILEALAGAGFSPKDVIFVCGYKAEVLRSRYPEFTYVENRDWESNNILASLFCARAYMMDGFVSSYTDTVYRGSIVRALVEHPGDRVLACDADWRRRYSGRSQHPESDGEKLRAAGGRVLEIGRTIAPDQAHGEFIGIARFSAEGARSLVRAYDRAALPARAYLVELFQRMIGEGTGFHHVDTRGGYVEIDTLEDLGLAEKWWRS